MKLLIIENDERMCDFDFTTLIDKFCEEKGVTEKVIFTSAKKRSAEIMQAIAQGVDFILFKPNVVIYEQWAGFVEFFLKADLKQLKCVYIDIREYELKWVLKRELWRIYHKILDVEKKVEVKHVRLFFPPCEEFTEEENAENYLIEGKIDWTKTF